MMVESFTRPQSPGQGQVLSSACAAWTLSFPVESLSLPRRIWANVRAWQSRVRWRSRSTLESMTASVVAV
jgi:hypothetical protein